LARFGPTGPSVRAWDHHISVLTRLGFLHAYSVTYLRPVGYLLAQWAIRSGMGPSSISAYQTCFPTRVLSNIFAPTGSWITFGQFWSNWVIRSGMGPSSIGAYQTCFPTRALSNIFAPSWIAFGPFWCSSTAPSSISADQTCFPAHIQ
jgi:hypothetical protein